MGKTGTFHSTPSLKLTVERGPRMPSTVHRVNRNTDRETNRRIQEEISERLEWYAGHRAQIAARLKRLDSEWDIERVLEANAATVAFAGVVLGTTLDKRFFALPGVVAAFLFQHAIQGWCPPLPVLRRLGFRTAREIEIERNALKAMRGDFRRSKTAGSALNAARL
jgi:hypothetical protein